MREKYSVLIMSFNKVLLKFILNMVYTTTVLYVMSWETFVNDKELFNAINKEKINFFQYLIMGKHVFP